ncbi:MAG: 50S ribosomal protein L13 [Candidatus Diapherotrites archaeon]|nr:50S ribosomal protein L13 [Candidatus Diapherotrites archaeon]
MVVINADNLVLGRLASIVAERALKGERIDIVNAEKAIVIGHKNSIIEKWKRRIDLSAKGKPTKGPKFPKRPDRMLRKAIAGMLPTESIRGRKALKRVRVFVGIPEKLTNAEFETIKIAQYNGKEDALTLGELSKKLGGKW